MIVTHVSICCHKTIQHTEHVSIDSSLVRWRIQSLEEWADVKAIGLFEML